MRIALVGHACSPTRGSEPGICWNWAANLAKFNDVTLIAHPQYRDEVDAFLSRTPIPALTIHWLTTNHVLDRWKPNKNERGLRLHYRIFQGRALDLLRELHAEKPFDLVHHACWGTLQQPPVVWKLGLPFVWGPIGGGQTWPDAFLQFAEHGKLREEVRTFIVGLTRFNLRARRAAHHADVVLAVNPETAAIVRTLGAKRVEPFADSGTQPGWLSPSSQTSPKGELNMLFGGRCEPRKGLPLLLEAMARVPNPKVRLKVAGTGPFRQSWEERAKRLGLNGRVQFLGEVTWQHMDSLFKESDILAFPSLRDSGGTVALEAISRSLPVLTLDHQGVSQFVSSDAAIKIPVSDPPTVINALADAIGSLAEDRDLRLRMGRAAMECAISCNWEDRAKRMTQMYEEILHAHRGV